MQAEPGRGRMRAHSSLTKAIYAAASLHGRLFASRFAAWDWVGGRFSVCSAVGVVPLSLQYGFGSVQKLLDAGADIVGIAVCDEFYYSLTGANAHSGTPVNARAPGRMPRKLPMLAALRCAMRLALPGQARGSLAALLK